MSYKYVIWLKVFITGVENMSTKLDEFKSQMTSFARPNLFEVFIYPRGQEADKRINLNCYTVSVPGLTIATTDNGPGYRGIAYQKLYEDVTLGFYVNEDMKEVEYIHEWMKLMVQPHNNHVGYYDDYKGTILIRTLSRSGNKKMVKASPSTINTIEDVPIDKHYVGNNITMTTQLFEAFPKSIEPITLDYGTNDDIMKFNAVFSYRYYQQDYGNIQPSGRPAFAKDKPIEIKEDKVKGTGSSNLKSINKNESNSEFMDRMLGR